MPSVQAQREWSGTWDLSPHFSKHDRVAEACCEGKGESIPFTPKYRKIRDAFAKLDTFTVEKNTDNVDYCITAGVPGTLTHPMMWEFVITPGRVTFIAQDGSVRRIWTDGRKFPNHLQPSPQGYSIGRWRDDRNLLVETRSLSPGSMMFTIGPYYDTPRTKVYERFSLQSDKSMQVDVTINEPEMFTRPFSFSLNEIKIPFPFEVACTNNRDTGYGKVDLTPPPELQGEFPQQ